MDAARGLLLGARRDLRRMVASGEMRELSSVRRDLLLAVRLLRVGAGSGVMFHRQTRAAIREARAAAASIDDVRRGFELLPDPAAVTMIRSGLGAARRALGRAVDLAHTGTHQ